MAVLLNLFAGLFEILSVSAQKTSIFHQYFIRLVGKYPLNRALFHSCFATLAEFEQLFLLKLGADCGPGDRSTLLVAVCLAVTHWLLLNLSTVLVGYRAWAIWSSCADSDEQGLLCNLGADCCGMPKTIINDLLQLLKLSITYL